MYRAKYVYVLLLAVSTVAAVKVVQSRAARNESLLIKRATLDNGLRAVAIRNPLAQSATVYLNYLAGANETPPGFPGMAHAQEHMAFRGCSGLSANQTAALFAQLGGGGNADTQQNITQYFSTVPAQDLEIALRIYAACMEGIDDLQSEWEQERGAIEQEVARDLSDPTYRFIARLNQEMFAGTPYAHDALGTKASFDATTGAMLKQFYKSWYAPNNAILVVAGDIDPDGVLAAIRRIYGHIPSKTLPPRTPVNLQPVKGESFTLDSNLPYTLTFLAYRLPGTDSPDFAAARILADALSSQRGNLYALAARGKVLSAEFVLVEAYPKASVGFAVVAMPAGADPTSVRSQVKQVLAEYARNGVPADLVEAAKRSEITAAEFQRNSIPGLAAAWSQALAAEGRQSPDEDVEAIRGVSVQDVNRAAKKYLLGQQAITATLKPSAAGVPVIGKAFGGGETLTSAPTKAVQLPDWAQSLASSLEVPQSEIRPADMTLRNGMRLIVQTVKLSPTVTVLGNVKHEPYLQTPPGKEGVDDVVDGLFSYGTKTRDRITFQKALDNIGATESGGSSFSLRVLKQYFSEGVQLLADNELNPAFPPEAFRIVRQQTADLARGNLASPGYRAQRALASRLVPKGDPTLREATPESISALTLDDVQAYYASTFRPDLTTIVIIGDVTADEAKSTIERWFGVWRASGPKPDTTLAAVPLNKPATVNIPDKSAIQDSVTLAEHLGLERAHPDYYALQLGNFVLGGGFYATRLYHDLRQAAGYVYNVENYLSATKTRTTYSLVYACEPQNVSRSRALIERDLVSMQTENVTPAELQQAKALLLRQIPLSESSEEAIASALLARAQLDLPLDEPIRAARRYLNMTADEIRAAFKKWVRPGDLVQVVRGPAPQ
jgi:zinc protease